MGKSAKVFREVVQEKRKVKGGLEPVWRVRIRSGNHVIVAATLADEYSAQVHDVAETIAAAVETARTLADDSDAVLARISELMNGEFNFSKIPELQRLTAKPAGKKQRERSDQRSQRRHHSPPRRDKRQR